MHVFFADQRAKWREVLHTVPPSLHELPSKSFGGSLLMLPTAKPKVKEAKDFNFSRSDIPYDGHHKLIGLHNPHHVLPFVVVRLSCHRSHK